LYFAPQQAYSAGRCLTAAKQGDVMPSFPIKDLGTLALDFSVDFPSVNFDCSFTGSGVVPTGPFQLGSVAVSWDPTTLVIPVSLDLPLSGELDFALDRDSTEVVVTGYLDFVFDKVRLGDITIPYMRPLRLPEPSWSVNPVKLDGQAVQAGIDAVPVDRYRGDSGAQSLTTDEMTQDLLRGVLTFAGAASFLDDMVAVAQQIRDARERTLREATPHAAAGDGASVDVLLAIMFGDTKALTAGVSSGGGIYIVSDATFGIFGSVAVDYGVIASLSLGLSFLVYWPVKDQTTGKTLTAVEAFSGWNFFMAGDIDIGVGVGAALYWPASGPDKPVSSTICGIGISVGAGVGAPANFYSGNSDTALGLTLGPYLSLFGIYPSTGSAAGGEQATIQGWSFATQSPPTVSFGSNVADIVRSTVSEITVTVPKADAPGGVDLTVTNPNGHSATLSDGFLYESAPRGA
jgi:hypothetical protein